MVVTDDPDLAEQRPRNSPQPGPRRGHGTWLRHVRLGYTYLSFDEMSAALGVAQLKRFEELRRGRARVAAAYERALGDIDWLLLLSPHAGVGQAVDWFVYVVRLDPAIDCDGLMAGWRRLGSPRAPTSRRSTSSRSIARRSASGRVTSR